MLFLISEVPAASGVCHGPALGLCCARQLIDFDDHGHDHGVNQKSIEGILGSCPNVWYQIFTKAWSHYSFAKASETMNVPVTGGRGHVTQGFLENPPRNGVGAIAFSHRESNGLNVIRCSRIALSNVTSSPAERDIFIDNRLVRIHLIIETIIVGRPLTMGV